MAHQISEHEYIIQLLEKILDKTTQIEKRLDQQEAHLKRHETVKHPFKSLGRQSQSAKRIGR